MSQQSEIIRVWLAETKGQLINNYLSLGLKASGKWADSLEPFQNETSNGYNLGMLGQDYTEYLEQGRPPNENQGEEALKAWVGWAGSTFIAQWVKDKNININPFAVAWKIARKGWSVPNSNNAGGLVTDIVTNEWVSVLSGRLAGASISDLKSDILKEFKQFKK